MRGAFAAISAFTQPTQVRAAGRSHDAKAITQRARAPDVERAAVAAQEQLAGGIQHHDPPAAGVRQT